MRENRWFRFLPALGFGVRRSGLQPGFLGFGLWPYLVAYGSFGFGRSGILYGLHFGRLPDFISRGLRHGTRLGRIRNRTPLASGNGLSRLTAHWRLNRFRVGWRDVPTPCGHLGFFFAAQFADRDRFNVSSAFPFDDFRSRTFVNHGLVHHLDLRDVDGLVDDGGVVHDHRGVADRLEEPLLAHKDKRAGRNGRLVNLNNAACVNPRRRRQRRPADVSGTLPPRNPGWRPLRVRHPEPAKLHAPIPAAIVVGGPTPRLIAGPIPAGIGPPPVTVGVRAPSYFYSRRPPTTSIRSNHHPFPVRAERLVKITFSLNRHDGRLDRRHHDRPRLFNPRRYVHRANGRLFDVGGASGERHRQRAAQQQPAATRAFCFVHFRLSVLLPNYAVRRWFGRLIQRRGVALDPQRGAP